MSRAVAAMSDDPTVYYDLTAQPSRGSGIPGGLEEFGHYVLLEELGRGAQGVVFLAQDKRLRRKVALKLLSGAGLQSEAVRERFRREAEIASKLHHPGICGIHEVGEEQGIPYIGMQYVQGQTLAATLAATKAASGTDSRPLTETSVDLGGTTWVGIQSVLRLFERVARSLHVAHEAGLVHRDIKPGNIMITPEGEPVLLDFGLARDLDAEQQTLTQSGQLMGTPAYMALEQIKGNRDGIDRRADVYGLTVSLYECLTLRRPFEAESWQDLFQQIRTATPPNPTKFNPRIPKDLRVVLEVGMERELSRRYPTAKALADDLERVRQYEPVRARAAGLVLRTRKWARANPTKAVAVTAVGLFIVAGIGLFAYQAIDRARAVGAHLRRAEARLAEADFAGALEAVAKALERDASSPRALELRSRIELGRERANREARKRADLLAARQAREEAAAKSAAYSGIRADLAELTGSLTAKRRAVFAGFAREDLRGRFAAEEGKAVKLQVEAERVLAELRAALERARRLESPWVGRSKETDAAFADFFMLRWRNAMAANDSARATTLRAAVRAHDHDKRYEKELHGRGTISVSVQPADADVYLFRYESYETVRATAPVPRLVPVPTSGVGRVRSGAWHGDFHPGDPCLEITAVTPGSLAASHRLGPGDVVLRLNGAPCGDGMFALTLPDALAAAGVPTCDRIESINDVPIRDPFDWRWSKTQREDGQTVDRLRFASADRVFACDKAAISWVSPADAIRGRLDVKLRLLCLRNGEPVTVDVPAGTDSGLVGRPTTYPLVCSPANRVGTEVAADPGSYLVVARRDGFETQRLSLLVSRLAAVAAKVVLLPTGTTPPGFVYVPPGPFLYGGDKLARNSAPERLVDLPGFFIAEREITNEQWFAFVNDPATLARIKASTDRNYLPRETSKLLVKLRADGTYRPSRGRPETAVYGISWNDAQAYLEWRNAKARVAGEPWVYDLPTGAEWEKAARGADGRTFPWGRRFDPSLTFSRHSKGSWLLDEAAGTQPRDASPYGVLDMGGSRFEWTKELAARGSKPEEREYYTRSGSWFFDSPQQFRSALRRSANVNAADGSTGLRLVARRER